MRRFQGVQDGLQHGLRDHEFQFPFLHAFHAALFAVERMRALQRAELSDPPGLPAAGIVVAETSGSGLEERRFHGLHVRTRHINIKTIKVHNGSL